MPNLLKSHKIVRAMTLAFASVSILAFVCPVFAEDTQIRIEKAVDVLDKLTDSSGHHGIRREEFAMADCVAVIPAFKKGAAVVGASFGRGFISCRNGETWSAPAAVSLKAAVLASRLAVR